MSPEIVLNNVESQFEFKRYFQTKLEGLLDEAPSDANATSWIDHCRDKYFGTLTIFSSERKFIAKGSDNNLVELTQALLQKVDEQIEEWRQTRFTPLAKLT